MLCFPRNRVRTDLRCVSTGADVPSGPWPRPRSGLAHWLADHVSPGGRRVDQSTTEPIGNVYRDRVANQFPAMTLTHDVQARLGPSRLEALHSFCVADVRRDDVACRKDD